MLWLDIRKQFVEEHFREWEVQKARPYKLGPLEHDTELVYHRHLASRQVEMDAADSREEEAKKPPPECQVAHEERRMQAMPTRMDVIPAGLENALYPNWKHKPDTKPKGSDRAQKEEYAEEQQTLEGKLDAKSVFDPLAPSFQSSQVPSSQSSLGLSPGAEVAGPKTPPHFCEGPVTVPPFDLSLLGMLTRSSTLSPVTDKENALLSLAPGSPVKNVVLTGVNRIARGLGHSSGSGSPMSIGSPAGMSVGVALKIKARGPMPAQFKDKESSSDEEEEMEANTESARDAKE